MSELTVVLDRREMVVKMDSSAIRIDRLGHNLQRIPLNMIKRVIVIGRPIVSCDVWRALAQKNIFVVLLPSKGNSLPVYIGPGLKLSAKYRMAQYKTKTDKEKILTIGRWLIGMKLNGQKMVLQKLGDKNFEIKSSCQKIEEFKLNLEKVNTIEGLMGYEGSAASEYFRSLSVLIPDKWKFSGRNKRPPKDPINAILSLSYVLAGVEIGQIIHRKGLDPAIGLIHSIQESRESLMLDILEPIRPIIDEFVLWLA